MDACCAPPPEAAAFEVDAELCEQLACDPTLEACCQRDLQQQAVEARLKAQLSLHDRSKQRSRVAAGVLGAPPPPTQQAQAQAQQQQQQSSGEEDEEEDEIVGRLRAQRLQELQRAAQHKARLQQQGHGGLGDVAEARLLREAAACSGPLVCHLAFEGSPLDDELDEHLAALAHAHLGTRFVRTRIGPGSTLHLRLRTPPGPGLLCFRDGSLVGAAGLDCFGAPECLLEETVDRWLRLHRALQAAPTPAGGGAVGPARGDGGGSGSEEEDGEEEGDDWQQPCEVCGRRYPHTHIRSVYATRHEGSGSDSEGDG